jgi:hypothetical protein
MAPSSKHEEAVSGPEKGASKLVKTASIRGSPSPPVSVVSSAVLSPSRTWTGDTRKNLVAGLAGLLRPPALPSQL